MRSAEIEFFTTRKRMLNMLNKIPPGSFLVIILAALMLIPAAGCDTEEEVYEMETDEEFQIAVETAVERFLRDDEPDIILNDLFEAYAERYPEEEIEEYVMDRVNEETEKINAKLEELEQKVAEAAEKADNLKEQLENQASEEALEDINEKLQPMYNWIDKLDQKIDDASDPGRIVDLMEEKINTYEELVSIIEEKLDSDRPDIRNNLEERDLLNYYHEIEALLDKERDIASAYEGVTGDNFISDQGLHDELKRNIIPETETLLDELKIVTPESEDVENLHDSFIDTWEWKLQGFKKMTEAIKNDDADKRAEAEDLIEEGSRSRDQFLDKMDDLF